MALLTVHEVQGGFIHALLGRSPKVMAGRPVALVDYRAAHARTRHVLHTVRQPLVMEVNHGRWLGVCPLCATGCCTDLAWPEARCFGCGGIFDDVRWPSQSARHAIEKALGRRLRAHQHYRHGQSVADLIVENITHGVHALESPYAHR